MANMMTTAREVSAEKEASFSVALTADLLAGKYSPGEWLKQADLEATYNVNRFEVRIALAELSVRGLLEHLPNRGYRVCKHTAQDWELLLELRSLLEVAACRLVVQRASDRSEERRVGKECRSGWVRCHCKKKYVMKSK